MHSSVSLATNGICLAVGIAHAQQATTIPLPRPHPQTISAFSAHYQPRIISHYQPLSATFLLAGKLLAGRQWHVCRPRSHVEHTLNTFSVCWNAWAMHCCLRLAKLLIIFSASHSRTPGIWILRSTVKGSLARCPAVLRQEVSDCARGFLQYALLVQQELAQTHCTLQVNTAHREYACAMYLQRPHPRSQRITVPRHSHSFGR